MEFLINLVAFELFVVVIGAMGVIWLLIRVFGNLLTVSRGVRDSYEKMSEDEKAKTRQAARDCAAIGRHLLDFYKEFRDAKK